ncbi:Chromatin structure remodeling complex protein sfh1 [Thecaphora frezii]
MADRPRRSTRNSSFNSPAHTPTPVNSSTPASRLVHHARPAGAANTSSSTPAGLHYPPVTPLAPPPGTPLGGGSLIQAGSALLSQSFPGFQPSQQHHYQLPYHQQHHQQQHLAAPHQPQMHQPMIHHLPNSWPLSKSTAPIPPFTPLAPPHHAAYASMSAHIVHPVPQALYTTFPSRMRAGVTTLMQPIHPSELYDSLGRPIDPLATPMHEARIDYGTPGATANPYRSSQRASKRRAAAGYIRYAEADDSADDFEEDLAATEDEASAAAAGSRGVKRKHVSPSADGGPGAAEQSEEEEFKSFLGLPPPGNKVVARRMFRPSAHLYHAEEDLLKQASRNEVLVPIRIELETETHRIKDTFTWNMNEKLISPYHFARLLLEDLDLPLEPYATQIQNMITQQVEEAIGVADIEMEPAAGGIWSAARLEAKDGELVLTDEEKAQYDPAEENVKEARQWDWGLARLDPEHKAWRQRMQQRLKTGEGLGAVEDDIRVIVDYEVQILRHSLRDRLEWDLCSPLTPEAFATQLCKDLGLTGEALGLISNSVREQLINHKRAALELGLLGTGKVLRDKEQEIIAASQEVMQERAEKLRRKLEGGGTETPRSEEDGSATPLQPPQQLQQQESPQQQQQRQQQQQQPEQGEVREAAMDAATAADDAATTSGATPAAGAAAAGDEDESEVETLRLTATNTAAPTREASASAPPNPPPPPAAPATRTSSRLAAASASALGRGGGSGEAATVEAPKLSATQRLHAATYTVREILSKGPRPLEGGWRDFGESREFGPLLERLSDEDLERLEEANVRASRRNRREAQRGFTASGRRRR